MKKEEEHKKEVVYNKTVDVTCDICLTTCKPKKGTCSNFEYLTLKTNWGYDTNKDTESWEAHVCEDCTDKYLKDMILFNKTLYMGKDKEFEDKLNAPNKRKRKIRSISGVSINVEVDDEDIDIDIDIDK